MSFVSQSIPFVSCSMSFVSWLISNVSLSMSFASCSKPFVSSLMSNVSLFMSGLFNKLCQKGYETAVVGYATAV